MKPLITFLIIALSAYTSEAKSPVRFSSYRTCSPVGSPFRAGLQISPKPLGSSTRLTSIALSQCPGTTGKCLRSVRMAVQKATGMPVKGVTRSAKDFGPYLVNLYGAKRLPISSPSKAPIGSIIVYAPKRGRGHGHIEIVTTRGFVSDHISRRPYASYGAIYTL